MKLDTRHPVGKMDVDTEDRLLPSTHYRYGLNGRSGTSDQDNVGGSENLRGNTRLDSLDMLSPRRVIGSCPDIKNNAIVELVYQPYQIVSYVGASVTTTTPLVIIIGSPSVPVPVGATIQVTQGVTSFIAKVASVVGTIYTLTLISGTPNLNPITEIRILKYHHIRRYFKSSNTFEFITNPALIGPVLDFQPGDRVYNPRVIEPGFDQLLTWVTTPDGVLRLINMDRMKFGGEYYNIAADVQYINLYQRPPIGPPTFVYTNDSTRLVNFIKERFYQFRYRYIYDDNEYSVCSVISKITRFPGYVKESRNALQITVNTGHHRVKKIEVIVRQGNGVSETGSTNPEWYVFATLDKDQLGLGDNASYSFNFYGDEQLTSISETDTDVIFDSIPDAADEIEVVNNNQIIAASITEGWDNIDIDCQLEPYYVPIGEQWGQGVNPVFLPSIPILSLQAGDFIFIQIIDGITFSERIYEIQPGDMASYPDSLGTALTAYLNSEGFTATYNTVNNSISLSGGAFFDNVFSFLRDTYVTKVADGDDFVYSYGIPGFKSGAAHTFGIVYYDEDFKNGAVQTDKSLIGTTRFFTEINEVGLTVYDIAGTTPHGFIPRFLLSINHPPPPRAKYYQIVYAQSNIQKVLQVAVNGSAFADGKLSFKIQSVGYYPNIDFLDFQQGDRVRFLSSNTAPEASFWKPFNSPAAPRYIDVEIESYNLSTGVITTREYPSGGALASGTMVEIYRKRQTQRLFFEFGQFYEIGDYGLPTAFHKANFQDQNILTDTPAIVNLTEGDIYYRNRSMNPLDPFAPNDSTNYLVESNSLTDFFESNYWNQGRPQIQDSSQKKQKTSVLMRWGNALISNTQVNNLSRWDEGSYNGSISARFGAITGLRQVGYTLRIIQWGNTNSAFIGRREIQNADASTQLVVTDNLIGTINPSEQEYGTKYPGSILVANTHLYFFDSTKARSMRMDNNGVHETALYINPAVDPNAPVSTMNKYWRAISDKINADPSYEIITGFDYRFGDFYMTFKSEAQNDQETLYHNQDENSWKYYVDMQYDNGVVKRIIDWYSGVGQSFFASMRGTLWEFNSLKSGDDPVYGSLFRFAPETDPVTPFVVETIAMIEPDKVKIFLTHNHHSNLAIEQVEFFIPPTTMYPNGMYSILKPANYQYKEGVYYADIKGDKFSYGIPADIQAERNAYVNGRPMRGHVMKVRVTFRTTQFVRFFSTAVGMIPSERS